MTERQYPIHLRRIGEPEIADYLESMVIEIDTHEKMFLELCEVKRERDTLLADAVPRDEYEALLKRFRHLLESDFIRSFDEYDRKTGTYKRDISEADTVAQVVRCGRCNRSIVIRSDDVVRLYCTTQNRFVGVERFCSESDERVIEIETVCMGD